MFITEQASRASYKYYDIITHKKYLTIVFKIMNTVSVTIKIVGKI